MNMYNISEFCENIHTVTICPSLYLRYSVYSLVCVFVRVGIYTNTPTLGIIA